MTMCKMTLPALVLFVTIGGASAIQAATPVDPYGRDGRWTPFLKQATVQKSLKLTDEQRDAVNKLKQAKDDNKPAIAKTLDAKQLRRLKQLTWAIQAGYALFDPELAKLLAITAEQNVELIAAAKVNKTAHKKMKSFLARARFRSRAAMMKYIAGYRNAADRRLMAVLTAGQKKKFAALRSGK